MDDAICITIRNTCEVVCSSNKYKCVQVTMTVQIWTVLGQDIDDGTEV